MFWQKFSSLSLRKSFPFLLRLYICSALLNPPILFLSSVVNWLTWCLSLLMKVGSTTGATPLTLWNSRTKTNKVICQRSHHFWMVASMRSISEVQKVRLPSCRAKVCSRPKPFFRYEWASIRCRRSPTVPFTLFSLQARVCTVLVMMRATDAVGSTVTDVQTGYITFQVFCYSTSMLWMLIQFASNQLHFDVKSQFHLLQYYSKSYFRKNVVHVDIYFIASSQNDERSMKRRGCYISITDRIKKILRTGPKTGLVYR